MAVTRIETGVAAGYWDRWKVTHALKELIANAKDATVTYRGATFEVAWEPCGRSGLMTITDTGGGFDKRCLMLGAGEEIRAGHIKRFHEGMKGAMLVAAREGLMFELATTGFSVPQVSVEQTQLGEDGFVIYADFEARRERGTVVTMECTEAQARGVATHFAGLKIAGLAIETTDDGRLIWPAGDKRGKVFVNGALATDRGEYLFNYNFDLEKLGRVGLGHLAERLKEGQNRDREHVDVESIEQAVVQVLSHCDDPEIIRYFLTAWQNGRSTRREYSLSYRYRSGGSIHPVKAVQDAWREVFRGLYPGKVCLPAGQGGFSRRRAYDWAEDDDDEDGGTVHEHTAALTLADHGWTVLPDDMPAAVLDAVRPFCQTVTQVIAAQRKTPQEKRMESIRRSQWTPEEEAVIEDVIGATCATLGLDRETFPGVTIFVRHFIYPDAPALWSGGKILVKRSHVAKAIAGEAGFVDLCASFGHEYGHKRGGHDHTAEFEQSLSKLLGAAIALNSERGRGVKVDRVIERSATNGWSDESAETFTWEQIEARFDGVARELRFSNATASLLAPKHTWAYLGVAVRKNKTTRPHQTFLFGARKDNRTRTPLTLGVSYDSRRGVRVVLKDGCRAIAYYGYTTVDEEASGVPFAEYDLAA